MFNHNNFSVGLDISDLSLKACQLSKKRSGIWLENFKSLRVPQGYIDKGRIIEKEKAAALINRILTDVQNGKIKQRLINTVLPETATFVKLIEIEKEANVKGLSEKIKKEISHHIPFSIDDVYLDWQKIETNLSAKNCQILVGVCPKEIVEEYINVLGLAGVIPGSLEVEALPITRSIFKIHRQESKSLSSKNIIVLDLGAARSSLILWREQRYASLDTLEFSVSLPLSGRQINEMLEKDLKLNPDQAEKFKVKCGLRQDQVCQGIIQKIIRPLLDQLRDRFKQSISFHTTHLLGATINKVVLCGGGANLKGLDRFLSAELGGIPVEYANPLINIKNNNIMSRRDAFSYATAIGLALKDFYL